MQVPFFRPSIEALDEQRMLDCVRSGWLTTGEIGRAFEEAIAEKTGARHVVAFSSCTAALHSALAWHALRPGDEVIVPTYTFVATAAAVHHAGGVPVPCDVRDDDLLVDVEMIERAVTPRTRGVVVVDLAGKVCDLFAIEAFCRKQGLFLIEDAAHSFGARHAGVPVGGHGVTACFSFYATKNVTTGEGGALVTDHAAVAAYARSFRLHGMDADAWKRYGGRWQPYNVADFGWKYNLPDVLAALGIGQIRRLEEMTARRRAIAARFSAALVDLPVRLPAIDDGHCWHLYMLRTDRRDALMEHLAEHEIATAVHYPPLHQLAVMRRSDKDFPVATRAYAEELSLPLYPNLRPDEEDYVIAQIRRFFEECP